MLYKAVQRRYSPLDYQIVQELASLRKEEESSSELSAVRPVVNSNVDFTASVGAVVKRLVRKGKLERPEGGGQGIIEAAELTASLLDRK